MTAAKNSAVGVVVIGRNEGERLKRCLRSVLAQNAGPVVYVDSGSDDSSVAFAKSMGVAVLELDQSQPFTMARGRNAGLHALLELHPELAWVHFFDGDCEVEAGWIPRAQEFLETHPGVVAVCGFRRERFPHASVYNHLIDMEWRGPVGEIKACGGDALYRRDALLRVGAFNEGMIAGEEPELCVRLRQDGGTIWRLDAAMTLHDAAVTAFGQWWRRSVRCGHAYAEGFAMHGMTAERHNARQLASSVLYGAAIPVVCGVLALTGPGRAVATTALALGYAKCTHGAYKDRRRRGATKTDALWYAGFCSLGKTPEALGVARYVVNRLRSRSSSLIEYKQ